MSRKNVVVGLVLIGLQPLIVGCSRVSMSDDAAQGRINPESKTQEGSEMGPRKINAIDDTDRPKLIPQFESCDADVAGRSVRLTHVEAAEAVKLLDGFLMRPDFEPYEWNYKMRKFEDYGFEFYAADRMEDSEPILKVGLSYRYKFIRFGEICYYRLDGETIKSFQKVIHGAWSRERAEREQKGVNEDK